MKPFVFFILIFSFFSLPIGWTQSCSKKDELIQRVKNKDYITDPSSCALYRDSLKETLVDCLISLDSFDASLWNLYLEIGYNYYTCDPAINGITYLQYALKAIENDLAPQPENLGRIHRLFAFTYSYVGRREEAFESIKMAIEYFEADTSGYLCGSYTEIANLFTDYGDYNQALTYLSKAEKILDPKRPFLAFIIENARACTFDRLGNYQEALAAYQKGMNFLIEDGIQYNRNDYAKLYGEIGHIYLLMEDYENATIFLNKALELYLLNPPENLDFLVVVYIYLVELEIEQNNFSKAVKSTDKPFSVLDSLDNLDYNLVHRLYRVRGTAYLGQNEFNKGMDDLQKAIKTLVPAFKPQNRENPILSLQYTGDKIELRKTLNQKAIAFNEQFEKTNDFSDLEIAYDTYLTLDTLITQTRQSFKAVGSKYFLQKTIIPIYDKAIQVALTLYEEKQERKYLETAHQFIARNKAIVLIEGLEDKKLKFSNIPNQLIERENRLLRNYNGWEIDLYNAEKTENTVLIAEIKDNLFRTKRDYDLLIQSFEKEYPNYFKSKYNYFPKLSIDDIQSKIGGDRAVIEFFVGDTSLYVSVVTEDDFKIHQSPIPVNFADLCNDFIEMARGESYENLEERFSKSSYELYQYLFKSALDGLSPTINRITIIPDDILMHISFDVLLTAPYHLQPDTWSEAPFFINKYAHHQVYANSLLFDTEAQDKIGKASKGFLGLGLEYANYASNKLSKDPGIQQRISGPLPFADDEVLGIQAIMGGDVVLNQKATKGFFIDNAPAYEILHLAMHGYSDEENHLNSALIFSESEEQKDNLLRVPDIFALDLSASLVYLSACQTNHATVKKGEGMSTISRAFAYAGCPSMVASLWNITDESSHKIAIDFYKNLQDGQSKDMALRNAKLTYLENTKMNGALPYLWAQTIVIGDPKPLVKKMNSTKIFLLGIGVMLSFLLFLFIRRK